METESGKPGFGIFKRGCVPVLFLLLTVYAPAQRLDVGLTYSFLGFYPTRFPTDIFFAGSSYRAYYIHKMQVPWGMQMHFSADLVAEYSRYFIMGRFGMNETPIEGLKYKYTYPVGNDGFQEYYSRIETGQTDISGSVGYILKSRRHFRPYLEIGVGRSSHPIYREDVSNTKSFSSQWTDQYELRDLTELDKPFNYLIVGFGYFNFLSARYNIRLGHHDVFYSYFDIGIQFFTKFSQLRKHYIYQPEE